MARSSFAKLQRDRDKRAKAAAKRERRQNRGDDTLDDEAETPTAPVSEENTEELLGQIARLHEAFDDGQIDFQSFEEQKAELMARLPVD
jgi:hypothetical protein